MPIALLTCPVHRSSITQGEFNRRKWDIFVFGNLEINNSSQAARGVGTTARESIFVIGVV